jgi:hypothetical protein
MTKSRPTPGRAFRLLLLAVVAWLLAAAPPAPVWQLVVCGWDELYILDISGDQPRKVWTWKAADRPELPAEMRTRFATIDECKPIENGRRILITASSNGAAIIDRDTGKADFWATVPNAHSIEMLPHDRVVVAASHSTNAPGDRLVFFDIAKPDREIAATELSWAHGVLWDSRRSLLWALGMRELRAYRLVNWDSTTPSVALQDAYPLPDNSGHDLSSVPAGELLAITTGRHVWYFDRGRREFSAYPELADIAGVKCTHTNPVTSQTVWTPSEAPNWWTEQIRFLNPARTIRMPGERIYKVRWIPPLAP